MYKLLLYRPYRRTRCIALAAVLSIALSSVSGCVKFEHSLAETRQPVIDDEIVGVWQLQYDPFPDRIKISALPDGEYRLSSADGAGKDYSDFVLVEAAGSIYLEVVRARSNGQVGSRDEMAWSFLFRWERRGEWIAIDGIDLASLKAMIKEGRGLRTAPEKSSLMQLYITSTPEELEEFLSAHAMMCLRSERFIVEFQRATARWRTPT